MSDATELANRLADAERTIEKAEAILELCGKYFARQAEMNAASHMSDRVLYSPLCAAIASVREAIDAYKAGR